MAVTYQNPVYPKDFADPFILRDGDAYYAFGTSPTGTPDRAFPVLRSKDLAQWEQVGHALQYEGAPAGVSYWAPEALKFEGKYYLYFSKSVGSSDEHHRLQVAVSDRPEGPYVENGRLLLPDLGFTIDAHPFCDPATGRLYLFFASDFESDQPHGTGISVVEMSDPQTVSSGPRTVVRASSDWHVYEYNRTYKGRTWPQWNCLEGPSVVRHDGQYYCFYSGGAWHGSAYGVGFAVAPSPMGPWVDAFSGHGPTVLKGVADRVIGPGHNSTVVGPDNATLFMVYHAWDVQKTARRMCIDPIRWTPDGPKVDGPTVERRTV